MHAKLQKGLGSVLQNAMRKETLLETNYGIENEATTVKAIRNIIKKNKELGGKSMRIKRKPSEAEELTLAVEPRSPELR